MSDITTGDKIKGSIKEGLGKLTGNSDLKHEGEAVHKAEKDEHKLQKEQAKAAEEASKMHAHAAKAGVHTEVKENGEVGVGAFDKAVGSIKETVGGLVGAKGMESEGKAVRKADEAGHSMGKHEDKAIDKSGDLSKHKAEGHIHH
eukprot:TRINITY_DN292_c0_g1_i1.p1 TRINITY_DN292_c0_g1~~TRINITY_DN292_c0_g1_i1.p1  ORF type:complete len:160 (-),score=70.16 TRINITY_DN292_c0_g1_i1:71-505(-)